MQLDQSLDEGEPDAEPADGSLSPAFHLRKHVEDPSQGLCRDSDPGVSYDHDDLVVPSKGGEPDPAAPFGVFGAVGEQVTEHLG